ncbi:MAG: N-acetylglucosamine-6-phosphate deacetylase [Proteobacteria bacterium]|nr:N-acetylglucosamine-6-phosphate deacetylase [Pseudomonadota bacterium]
MLYIKNATIITPDEQLENASLSAQAEWITSVDTGKNDSSPATATVIDARGMYLVPGFIDLQCNGAFGRDFTADPGSIWPVAARLPRFGVTSFLPTIITSPQDTISRAQSVLSAGKPPTHVGAWPIGLHLEGPFLNPHKRGAHERKYLRLPTMEAIENWRPAQGVRMVTMAPELPGAPAVVEQLARRGVVVSAGHSNADFTTAKAGFAAGITYGTHLFNAMPPLGQREPGLCGALMDSDQIVVGLIADGIHVHPAMIRLTWRSKAGAGMTLVSDAMAGLGMTPGRYLLNESEVFVGDACARLADGTLAGSITPLDSALRNLVEYAQCTLEQALPAVTSTPARVLGLSSQLGRIAEGHIADLVLLNAQLQVMMTITAGEITYTRESDE